MLATAYRISQIPSLRRRGVVFRIQLLAVGLPWLPTVSGALPNPVTLLSSPNGGIQVSIQIPETDSRKRPSWSAIFHGKQVLNDCEAGLETADAGDLLKRARVLRVVNRFVDQRVGVLFGKSARSNDRFHEARFALETSKQRRADLIFRCYDDAIALRYELPDDTPNHSVTITDETTSFRVEGDPTAYVQVLENYKTSHEHNVTTT